MFKKVLLPILLFSLFSALYSQDVNVSINTSVIGFNGELWTNVKNVTYFYDASNYPFVSEVPYLMTKQYPIKLPKGKYIIKSIYKTSGINLQSLDPYLYTTNFYPGNKSFFDSPIVNIDKDTILDFRLVSPVDDGIAGGAAIRIMNTSKDTIKSFFVTSYEMNPKASNGFYQYYSSSNPDSIPSFHNRLIINKSNYYYFFIFDPTAQYLPGYLTKSGKIVQNLSQADLIKYSYYSNNGTATKVISPEGQYQIKGILDSALLKLIQKNEDQIQAIKPLKTGIVVAYNIDNIPVGYALTDENGRFKIGKLTPGTYTIKANYLKMEKTTNVVIDAQGNSNEVSITLDVDEQTNHSQINLYPNPVTECTNVTIKLNEPSINIVILSDLIGNELIKFDTEYSDNLNFNLDLSGYPAGTYNLTVINGQNVVSKQVVKN